MKLDVGFVGFDGTESKRAILAIHQVKEAEGIKGDMNVLLRSPHGRAKSMLSKFTRMCNIRAFLTDEKDRAAWEKDGARIEGGYDDFFEESGVIVVGTPGGQELPNVEASIAHDCNMVLMGGANRGDILNGLAEKNIGITEKIREDMGREFFFGLENYDRFLKAAPKLVQCTSCNTTALCRAVLAARPLGLRAVLGNLDRRSADPHDITKVSPNAIQFGSGVGHQGNDAATVFKDVKFSIRASKVPITMPHVHQLNFVFEGEQKPETLLEQLSNTRRVVIVPYDDAGKKHDWTGEILEAFVSGFERPISPEIFELLISDTIIPVKLGNYTIMQIVMLVEQMSIPVPNYAEAYLMFCGFPADNVHSAVDRALGVVHGVWPNKLA
ncbi:MAG: glyceraldehyde-3-phosphate dehydrogenase [Methanothrix sp.]|nr:MAG: glyceraldehyde-3-phosphate dehydrogenase [Methanothrix sp.]